MNCRDSFRNHFQRPWMITSGAALSKDSFIPQKTLKGILVGGVTGCIEVTIAFPAEYVKVQLQLDERLAEHKYKGIVDVVKSTVQARGFKGLYRGYNVCLYGSVPKVAVRFGTFESLKRRNVDEKGNLNTGKRFLCALGAGIGEAILVVTPFESIEVKFIHDNRSPNPKLTGNFFQGIHQIVNAFGIRGLYQALLPTILKQGTNQAIRIGGVETLKDWYTVGNPNQSINKLYIALFGLISGAISVTANTPLDVIKTKMQGLDSKKYKNTFHCARSIAKCEGFFGFYKGYVPRLILVCLDCIITFTVYDSIMGIVDKIWEND